MNVRFTWFCLLLFAPVLFGQVPGSQRESPPALPGSTSATLQTAVQTNVTLKQERIVIPTLPHASTHTELQPSVANISIGDIAGAGIGNMLVKDLLQDFVSSANQMLFSAQNTGSALLSQAGSELNVATQNVGIVLGDKLDKTVNQLDPVERDLFAQLKNLSDTADNLPGQVAHVVDLTQLDLTQLTNRLPFTKKTYFYLSTVNGLTQTHQGSDYKVGLTGIGLGYNDDKTSYQVVVTVGRKQLPATAFQRPDNHILNLTIPHDFMDPFFDDTKIGYVPVHLSSTVTRKRFPKPFVKTYDINLTLLTLPKHSGNFVLTEPFQGTPHLDGKTLIDSVAVTMNAGTCHSNNPCDWSRDHEVASNQQIINVRMTCTGQCGFCYNLRRGGYDLDYDILNGGTKATVYRHCDGDAQTTTVTHYFDYQTMTTDTLTKDHPSQGIAFGDSATIDLDPKNVACTYELNGTLITGQTIKEDANSALDAKALLKASGMPVKFGDHCRVTFTLNAP